MKFIFNGEVRRPVSVEVEAVDAYGAVDILEAARSRGSLDDPSICIYDEDRSQRMASFDWDGEPCDARISKLKSSPFLVRD